jgi:hypothetical protein
LVDDVIDQFPPEHMDEYSRNERLYRFLLAMGLYVVPIRLGEDPSQIDYMQVSVTAETAAQVAQRVAKSCAETSIDSVVEGTEVGEVIRPAERDSDGVVINLPPIRR